MSKKAMADKQVMQNQNIKIFWLASVLLSAALVLCFSWASLVLAGKKKAVSSERLQSALEQHELKATDGSKLSWQSIEGEVVVVSFWASWCKPCQKELPELGTLHREISDKGGRVVAISIDQDIENVRRFAKKHKLDLPLYHDGPDGLAATLDLPYLPMTLVLDRSGKIAHTANGANKADLEELATATRKLVAGKAYVTAVKSEGKE